MRYVRAAALIGVLGFSFFAAGCSGNGGGATPPMPVPNQAAQPGTAPSPGAVATMATASYNLHVHGQIVAVKSSTEFQINGGSGVGYLNVYTSSSTSWNKNGLTVKAGYYADVYGNGTVSTYVTATQVTLSTSSTFPSPAPSPTGGSWNMHVHGPIVAIKSSTEFQINGGSGVGYLNVYTNSSTVKNYNGLPLSVGYYADIYGNGSISTYVTATQITLSTSSGGSTPAPAPSSTPYNGTAPSHVMTAAIVWGYGGVPTSVSIASVKPYVTWVQTGSSYASEMRSNGLKVDIYENFWRNYSSDNPNVGYVDLKPGGAHAPAEAKTCAGSVIYDPSYGGGYEADARSSYAAGHAQVFNNYRISEYGGHYDAVFSDDTGAMGGISLPCNWSNSAYQSAVNAVDASLKVPVFVNTLGAAANPVDQVGYASASNVIGAMCEICFAAYNSSGVDYPQTGSFWQGIEDAAIDLVNEHKIFWDYARAIGNPSSETSLRNYIYASFLLTYSPSYSMLQEAFKSAYAFPVMPETGFVPLNPTTTASTVTGYLTSTGAYMRQYGACYYRGSYKGKCAVVVNPGSSTVSIPTTAYTHSLGLVGGGVLDGGYVTFTNSRPSSLGPAQGVILLP
jgi:hypothetical protein